MNCILKNPGGTDYLFGKDYNGLRKYLLAHVMTNQTTALVATPVRAKGLLRAAQHPLRKRYLELGQFVPIMRESNLIICFVPAGFHHLALGGHETPTLYKPATA